MVANFVSADYGYLCSPDGSESSQVLFRASKNKEGYFMNEDILMDTQKAMDILNKFYPNEEHVLVFNNATTHLKRADNALSARKMPKGTSKPEKNWGVEVTATAADGSALYDPGGKLVKTKVRMGDGLLASGEAQSLYFPQDHKDARLFKGMAVILCERGFIEESKLHVECKGFKCLPGATTCCCHCILFNQPDFVAVKSPLEITCKLQGVKVLFLPKFHCELNFIEQCWGYAKRIYREFPASFKEADLEKNVITPLDSVPLESMRRYAWRSWRFMMFYGWGLDRKLAAWTSKKYQGHHVITEALMETIDREAPK
ncbi:hypothetical protein BDN71DRAFT_1390261 [Pleurotus eryngii]|uniref:DDE-1 domain-containing protein n=1 Tax=Pleurotus eryngii TaxID=5323 RepID=A0A9P6DGH8_PLEER|nr:hypothetical protein BDN71DRAFT_1390261 [Pleurotus eryngii]